MKIDYTGAGILAAIRDQTPRSCGRFHRDEWLCFLTYGHAGEHESHDDSGYPVAYWATRTGSVTTL